jgi:hypothetical protein
LRTKVCHCNDRLVVPPESSGSSGSGSAEDPFIIDRAETPDLEYHTPPIAPSSPPITTPLEENLIPLQVRLDLGTSPLVDSDQENRPSCCQIPRTFSPLQEIPLEEDEVVSPADVQRAIVRYRYSGRAPVLMVGTGNGRASGRSSKLRTAFRGAGRILARRVRSPSEESGGELERNSSHRSVSPGVLPQDDGGRRGLLGLSYSD